MRILDLLRCAVRGVRCTVRGVPGGWCAPPVPRRGVLTRVVCAAGD